MQKICETSSLAVTIAQADCPSSGNNASVAAVAIAVAASTNLTVASNAIAGVIAAGVDVTLVAQTLLLQPASPSRKAATQALGLAVLALTPEQQDKLLGAIGKALDMAKPALGCGTVSSDIAAIIAPLNNPKMTKILCDAVTGCTDGPCKSA